MGTAARTVTGVVGLVAVWLVLATTLFAGTGPAGPGPRACVAGPGADARLLAAAGTAGAAACPAPVPRR